jgi:CO/xanthine dehydrogenase FAD-binding subunit
MLYKSLCFRYKIGDIALRGGCGSNLTRGHTLSTHGLYIRPRTLAEAVTALSPGSARILCGGTDFFPAQGERPVQDPVVDVSALEELRGVICEKNYFRIGGVTTWTDIIRAPLPRAFDALKSAAREIGSIQIQNRGTVAGNLCNASPAADGVPPLLALDAEVELASSTGTRRICLQDFILGNRKTARRADEILTAVLIPRAVEDAASCFLKLGARRYLVISIAMVAAIVQTDSSGRVADARIAVGSCSAVARRLHALESELIGIQLRNNPGRLVRRDHLAPLSPIDDVRATASYRMDAALMLVQRALNGCGSAA